MVDFEPRVWLVMSYRAGENSQILALGEALGWQFEKKVLSYRRWQTLGALAGSADISGVVRKQSSPLESPWPDLVISAGFRNEPVCQWIRRQTGGRCRIVMLGRIWTRPDAVDLLITTPQYRVAPHPHVLQNRLVLHRVTPDRLREAAEAWAPKLASFPRPYIAVMIGGNSGPYTLGPRTLTDLGTRASALAKKLGGSLLVTTSSRTDAGAVTAMESALDAPARVYRWSSGDPDNPYFGFLALADSLVVTGDSVAMLSEAAATGKTMYLYDPLRVSPNESRPGASIYRFAMRIGPRRLSRDVSLVHDYLVASGRAVWMGEEPSARCPDLPLRDLDNAVQRVRLLFPEAR